MFEQPFARRVGACVAPVPRHLLAFTMNGGKKERRVGGDGGQTDLAAPAMLSGRREYEGLGRARSFAAPFSRRGPLPDSCHYCVLRTENIFVCWCCDCVGSDRAAGVGVSLRASVPSI